MNSNYFQLHETQELPEKKEMRTALVVDDDEGVRRVVKCFLERRLKLTVHVAGNGAEGIEQASLHHFDLIVSDINMPVMDGITFYEWLREHQPDIIKKFLFMTGGYNRMLDERLSQADKTPVLEKPLSLGSFIKNCDDILRS